MQHFCTSSQLRMARIVRLNPDELVQVYSYLLNLDRSLMTRKAAGPTQSPKKLGRVHIGIEGDYLRVGKQYCQMLSVVEPPRGTRPDLWGATAGGGLQDGLVFDLAAQARRANAQQGRFS